MNLDRRSEPSGRAPRDASEAQLLAAVRAALVPGALLPAEDPSDQSDPPAETAAEDQPASAIDRVQLELRAYVSQLKRQGATPERVLISVKQLLRPSLQDDSSPQLGTVSMSPLSRIVEWTVVAYYRDD